NGISTVAPNIATACCTPGSACLGQIKEHLVGGKALVVGTGFCILCGLNKRRILRYLIRWSVRKR
ncbi:hypothetical protein Q6249_29170, partial [Klebsiella pneumoniae]